MAPNSHGDYPNTNILWEKQSNKIEDFDTLPNTGTSFNISDTSEEHAGVYYAYWDSEPRKGALVRLIVKG